MSTLATYRALIPAHAAIPDVTIETWLELAARRLSATAFGVVYVEACIFYAASGLDALVQAGQAGALGQVCAPAASGGKQAAVDPNNIYWARFVDLRDSRAAGGPTVVGMPSEAWPTGAWPWP